MSQSDVCRQLLLDVKYKKFVTGLKMLPPRRIFQISRTNDNGEAKKNGRCKVHRFPYKAILHWAMSYCKQFITGIDKLQPWEDVYFYKQMLLVKQSKLAKKFHVTTLQSNLPLSNVLHSSYSSQWKCVNRIKFKHQEDN